MSEFIACCDGAFGVLRVVKGFPDLWQRFYITRCKNCMKICLSKMPPRTELSDTHYTYCWLQQKAAFEKGEKAE